MIEYKEIMDNKKKYLPLLLIADEQESAIDAYWSADACTSWKTAASAPSAS